MNARKPLRLVEIFLEAIASERNASRHTIEAYRRALQADAGFADAHFNLARLYEHSGKRAAALRHLKAYKQLIE